MAIKSLFEELEAVAVTGKPVNVFKVGGKSFDPAADLKIARVGHDCLVVEMHLSGVQSEHVIPFTALEEVSLKR